MTAACAALALVACTSGGGTSGSTGGSTAPGTISGSGGTAGGETSSSASGGTASGGSGGTTASGGLGGTGGSGGEPCLNTDPGEPNDVEADAYSLGMIGCSDSDPGMIYGILAGPDDVDWFTYDGSDDTTCLVNPTTGLVFQSEMARVCAYFECHKGGTDPGACPAGTTADTSPAGRPGCCGFGTFTVDLNCTGTLDESSTVYIRVDDPSHSSICGEYTVSYHF